MTGNQRLYPIGLVVWIQILYFCTADDTNSNYTYEYRLVGGKSPFEGHLEIRRDGSEWGPVATWVWSYKQASLACQALGFSASYLSPEYVDKNDEGLGPVHVRITGCFVSTLELMDCAHTPWDDPDVIDDYDYIMSLKCLPAGLSHSLRLVGGDQPNKGVIQVYDGVSKWGYICGDTWKRHESNADVICRNLGYQIAIRSYCSPRLSMDEGSLLIASIFCPFSNDDGVPASTLDECNIHPWFPAGCATATHAAVECLQGNQTNGRYEIQIGDIGGDFVRPGAGIIQAKLASEKEWRTACFRKTIYWTQGEKIRETIGRHLCSSVNNNGNNVVRKVDDCELFQLNLKHQTSPSNLLVVDGYNIGKTGNQTDNLLGHVVVVDESCSKYAYEPYFIECLKEVTHEGVEFLYRTEFSCQGRCGYDVTAFCHCDAVCEVYQDGCYDYHSECPITAQSAKKISSLPHSDMFSCTILDDRKPAWTSALLVSKCPAHWNESFTKDQCENLPTYEGSLDPNVQVLYKWPVFDEYGTNFKNIYCALCNGINLFSIETWNTSVVNMYHSRGACAQKRDMAFSIGQNLRSCHSSMIDSCSPNSMNDSVEIACRSYAAPVCYDNELYKNPHCALCNGKEIPMSSIIPCFKRPTVLGTVLGTVWIFQQHKSSPSQYQRYCASKVDVFDPFTHECRRVSCSPGLKFNSSTGKCDYAPGVKNAIAGMCCSEEQGWIIYNRNVRMNEDPYIEEDTSQDTCFVDYLNDAVNMTIGKAGHAQWRRNVLTYSYYQRVMLHPDKPLCNMVTKLYKAILQSNIMYISCEIYSLEYMYVCGKTKPKTCCDGQWYQGSAEDFQLVDVSNIAEVFRYKDHFIIPTIVLHQVTYEYDHGASEFKKQESVLVCGRNLTSKLNCPLITIANGDYEISNSHIVIRHDNFSWTIKDFVMLPDGRVQICAPVAGNLHALFQYNGYLDVFNTVGSVASMIGLWGTFAIHCLFPKLRNFHGHALMCLSLALFSAYVLPFLSMTVQISGNLCVFWAAVSHYFWLASFCWSTIIAANLSYTFIFVPLQRTDVRERKPVFRYVLPTAGWCLPLMIVITCLLVHVSENKGFKYGSNSPCWIADLFANLVAFGIPVAASLTCNVICFVTTVTSICRSTSTSRTLQHMDRTVTKADMVLGVKMSLLMGIGWIFGFIASFSDNLVMWWIFSAVTSPHGVWIFVVVCSGKHVKAALCAASKQRPSKKGVSVIGTLSNMTNISLVFIKQSR